MANPFVHYLNSLNSADANAQGALAESQVTSPYYEKVIVRLPISDSLRNIILENPSTIILTGHAGDGKTSLLVQLLKDLDCLPSGEQLKMRAQVTSADGVKVFYVKDMSELTKVEQVNLFTQALEAPSQGSSAVLVTNTGPLINVVGRLNEQLPKAEQVEATSSLLEGLDVNDSRIMTVAGKPYRICNMAHMDNVNIGGLILKKLISEDLWQSCQDCSKVHICPIYQNQKQCAAGFEQIAEFCSSFYRHLHEHDNRLTIRQITAHISYALTGNLSCDQVAGNKNDLFNYHFANLMFGYVGFQPAPKAAQIRAITELQKLELDTIGLDADFSLFVQRRYETFSEEAQSNIRKADALATWHLRRPSSAQKKAEARLLHRRAIRRFYLLFSQQDDVGRANLLRQLYSPLYPVYLKAVAGPDLERLEKREIRALILKALYVMFVGMPAPVDDIDEIPLPVRRDNVVTQYVQLLQGAVPSSHISVQIAKIPAHLGLGNGSHRMELKVNNLDANYVIRFPVLDYFWHVANGSVATSLAPSLSHGINRLKARLVKSYSNDTGEENKQFQLLLVTNKGTKKARVELVGNQLYID